ncbi:MAG: hypothetical protein PGN09_09195 [Sphingomonas fennica]
MERDWQPDDDGEAAFADSCSADADRGPHAPLSILQSERRVHVRAYNRWARLRAGRAFPHARDLSAPELAEFLPRAVILRYPAGDAAAGNPEILYIGRALRAEAGLDAAAQPAIADIPPGSLVQRMTARHADIAGHSAPVGIEAEYVGAYGEATLYRGVMLPFSTDGVAIDHVCGIVNWKLAAADDVTADMQDAIEQVRTRPMVRPAAPIAPFPLAQEEYDRRYLRDRPSIGAARVDPPGDEEFVLLVARRAPDGSLAVIATLPADGPALAAAARAA